MNQPEPNAYLVEYREVSKQGEKKHCVEASLEPRAPSVSHYGNVESRELLKVTPLYARPEVEQKDDAAVTDLAKESYRKMNNEPLVQRVGGLDKASYCMGFEYGYRASLPQSSGS